jgi:hypothetical protein
MSEERKKILDMVRSGQISPEQGAALLNLVSEPEEGNAAQEEPSQPPPPDAAQVMAGRALARPFWMYPLGAGLVLVLVGATVVTSMHQQQRVNAWTWLCGWIPLFVGLAVATLAAWARTAHWIHLRVRDHGKRVTLSLPLPLGPAAAVIRVARPYVPRLRETGVDEAILALREGLQGNEDITIDVQDDDEGESVQILFGGEQ